MHEPYTYHIHIQLSTRLTRSNGYEFLSMHLTEWVSQYEFHSMKFLVNRNAFPLCSSRKSHFSSICHALTREVRKEFELRRFDFETLETFRTFESRPNRGPDLGPGLPNRFGNSRIIEEGLHENCFQIK